VEPDLNQIVVASLRGGLNLTDPPAALRPDQTTLALNTDFSLSTCGARRRGIYTIPPPTQDGETQFLFRETPTGDPLEDNLIAIVEESGTGFFAFSFTGAAWNALTFDDTPVTPAAPGAYSAQNLHGKMFLAYPSGEDRLHVLDAGTTVFRRVGLATPAAAPTVANTGAGAYAAVLRYYRIRYTVQVAGTTVRRSEPSASQSFTPSGAGTAARVTKPATINEDETHWELEASTDNVNFYRIATTVVATTTYDDSAATNTYSSNPLSADVGDYTVPFSVKYLSADEDRLVMGGSWDTEEYASRVTWTPVFAASGVGNDERLDLSTFPYLDLDNLDGGGITGMSVPTNGYIYVFKRKRIYKLVRTGQVSRSYEAVVVSKSVGAVNGSVVSGFDASGNPCVYFWDDGNGPHRIGTAGIEDCSRDIRPLATELNPYVLSPVRAIYYPDRDQMWFWAATSGSNIPDRMFVFQIRDGRRTEEGVVGGWGEFAGPMVETTAAAVFRNYGEFDGTEDRPFLALSTNALSNIDIVQADTLALDKGEAIESSVTTMPFMPAGMLRKIGAMAATALAKGIAGSKMALTLVRDYGKESASVSAELSPTAAHESRVFAPMDDAALSELRTLQMTIRTADPDDYTYTGAVAGVAAPMGAAFVDMTQIPVISNFTIGAWVYTTDAATGPQTYFYLGKDGEGFGLGLSGGNWVGEIGGEGLVGGTAAVNGGWKLLIMTVAAAQQLYVDGVASGAPTAYTPNVPTYPEVAVASRMNALETAREKPMIGRVAHAFFITRVLNADEILGLFQGGLNAEPLAPFLVGPPDADFVFGSGTQPWNYYYFPLQSATDLTDLDQYYTMTAQNLTTAAGPSVAAAPTPMEIDRVTVQIRLEERQ
jgi:hypothetical protein